MVWRERLLQQNVACILIWTNVVPLLQKVQTESYRRRRGLCNLLMHYSNTSLILYFTSAASTLHGYWPFGKWLCNNDPHGSTGKFNPKKVLHTLTILRNDICLFGMARTTSFGSSKNAFLEKKYRRSWYFHSKNVDSLTAWLGGKKYWNQLSSS